MQLSIYSALWCMFLSAKLVKIHAKVVNTIVGFTASTPWGNGGPGAALKTKIISSRGITSDTADNLYIADAHANAIRKITPDGSISTFAGGGTDPNSNPISATVAYMDEPWGIARVGPATFFISERNGHRIRYLDMNGDLTTYVGQYGIPGFVDGQFDSALLHYPCGLFYDSSNLTLYIVDSLNHAIRTFTLPGGAVSTIAGNGTMGFFNSPNSVLGLLAYPSDIWMNASSGHVYIADTSNCRIRVLIPSSPSHFSIETSAGTGTCDSTNDGQLATTAAVQTPGCVSGDDLGNIFFGQSLFAGLRVVTANQTIYTVAGSFASSLLAFGVPTVRVGSSFGCRIVNDNLIFTDNTNGVVWKVTNPLASNAIIELVAGFFNWTSVAATSAPLSTINGIWCSTTGNLYISDTDAHRVGKLVNSKLSVFAGTGLTDFNGDSIAATLAALNAPSSVVGNTVGIIYIADSNHRIRRVQLNYSDEKVTNVITTIAGTGTCGDSPYDYSGDLLAYSLCHPRAMTIDSMGDLYIADDTCTIKKIDLTNDLVFHLIGNGTAGFSVEAVVSSSAIHLASGLWMGPDNILYFTDGMRKVIRGLDVDAGSVVVTAGDGTDTFTDSVIATASGLGTPTAVCGDTAGTWYIVHNNGIRIVKVGLDGMIATFAADIDGNIALGDEYVEASNTRVGRCTACHVDSKGTMYYSEVSLFGTRVRQISDFLYPSSQPSVQPSRQPSRQPTRHPIGQPSGQPSRQPRARPTSQPSRQPTSQPSRQPSIQPHARPSTQPSTEPSRQPVLRPTAQPSRQPTSHPSAPTSQPSRQPSRQPQPRPSSQPSRQPSMQPSRQPQARPTSQPSREPSMQPFRQPCAHPSSQPSMQPSLQPATMPTVLPTSLPSQQPSSQPSGEPSSPPSCQPSALPTAQPSQQPSGLPSAQPSMQPIGLPTEQPSAQPSGLPSDQPRAQPSAKPSEIPTAQPNAQPTNCPSTQPTCLPISPPTGIPSSQPSRQPSGQPSTQPSGPPSGQPSALPSTQPSAHPSAQPSRQPSSQPCGQPSSQPSGQLSGLPSGRPSTQPSLQPSSGQPTGIPSSQSTCQPSDCPSLQPSARPSCQPSSQPTGIPSSQSTVQPTCVPSGSQSSAGCVQPSSRPFTQPSAQPSEQPSAQPSEQPNAQPSKVPTALPTVEPSPYPSSSPSVQPSGHPSRQPTRQPSASPTGRPSRQPAGWPSLQPSTQPTTQPSVQPSFRPSVQPSVRPSNQPTLQPYVLPSARPSAQPSSSPSVQPSTQPTSHPSTAIAKPSAQPSSKPSHQNTARPSSQPTRQPSQSPSRRPSSQPTSRPSAEAVITVFVRSAVFAGNGLQVAVNLNVATNLAGYGNQRFACDQVLSFAAAASYICFWGNASQLIILDTVRADFFIGSAVALAADSGLLVQWGSSQGIPRPRTVLDFNSSSAVLHPAYPDPPVIGSFAPTIISRCSNWQLDLCSATVLGNAGRAWKNMSFAVQGDLLLSNTTLITTMLYKQSLRSTLLVVPNVLLVAGEQYTVQVRLCNAMGGCAARNMTTTVSSSNGVPPVVSILGSAATMQPSDALTLTSNAYTLLCNGQRSAGTLQYAWKIRLSSNSTWISRLLSVSKDKSKYSLPPQSLLPSQSYVVMLSVRDSASNLSASAVTSVTVLPSDLIAKITPAASTLVFRAGSILVLNASASYDPDDRSTALVFKWSCASGIPLQPCLLFLNASTHGTVSISANEAAINSSSTIRVLVSDAATKQRNSSATVQVQVIEPTKPLISLLPSAVNLSYINLDQGVSLQSTVLSPLPCNATWQALPKDKVLLAGNVLAFKAVPGNRLANVNLYLPAFSLQGGLSYTFTISCSSSTVSIAVATNNPPQGGKLSAQPEAGFALNTSFLLITELWNDADLPLAFTFAFWSSADSSYLSIRRKSVVSSASAILLSGDGAMSRLNVSVIAEDSYNASSGRRLLALKVSPLPSLQAVAFVSNLLTTQNISADELQNVLSVATTVLNQVPCSSAPNCSSLHRVGCKATANTCGACATGYVTTGKAGDDNSQCLSLSAVSAFNVTKSTRTCSASSAGSVCATWQYCNSTTGTCKDQSKQCSSPACSSNGRCGFQSSSTGMAMNSCPLTSASCDALCLCNLGYAGDDCGLTTAEVASQQALRSQLMSSLTSVMTRTDSDASSLANAANSLYTIIRNQYDVTALLASQVASFIMNLLNQAAPLTEQVALKIASVLAPVNAALQSISSSNSSSAAAAQAGNLSVALDAFQQLLNKEQQPFSVVYDSFRVSSQSIDTSQNGSVSYKVDIPLTDAEKAAQSLGQASTLPSVSILPTQGNSSTGSVFVSVVVLDQQQWKSNATSLVSDIVTVRANNVDFVDITLHSSNTAAQAPPVNYTISCPPRIRVLKNYTCTDSGYIDHLQCNGTAGSFFGVCPVLLATCSALNTASQGIAAGGNQCSAINSTSAGITCRCTMSNGGVVAAGLVMKYVGSDFSSPFKSAASFNNAAAVGKAYIIIVLYSALWGCAAVMMAYCGWYWTGGLSKKKAADGQGSSAVAPDPTGVGGSGVACFDGGESGEGAASRKARQQLAAYISAIFPAAFAAKSTVAKMTHEFMEHHLYVNFAFRLKYSASPMLSLVIMITMQSFLLWLLALLYDLNYPSDDGSCVYFITEPSCLNRKYVLDSQHSYCQWRSSDASCLFSDPSFSVMTGLFISVMTSVATCLVLEPFEYLMALLRSPTLDPSTVLCQPAASAAAAVPLVSAFSTFVKVLPDIEDGVLVRAASTTAATSPRRLSSIRRHLPSVAAMVHENNDHDLVREFQPVLQHRQQRKLSLHSMKRAHSSNESSLFEEIALQRTVLQGDQLVEFDAQWGLDSTTGAFLTKEHKDFCFRKHTVSMESLIQQEQMDAKAEASGILEELSTALDAERGFEILQAFVKDLLGRRTPSGRIFATKAELDCEKEQAVAWSVQMAVAVFIFLLNGFFIYYTILKGYDKGLAWQYDYVKAWLVQLFLDIFVFETVQCAWIHVIVPSLVSQEVCRANDLLQRTMESVYDGSYEEQYGSNAVICLNAPEHLFVSHRLADAYPELLESKMVKAYASHLPGALGKVWQSKLKNQDDAHSGSMSMLFSKTFLLSLLVQLAAYAPVHIQSIFIRIMEPVLLAGLTFVFVLFLQNPAYLSIVGVAVLLFGGVFTRDYYRTKGAIAVQPVTVVQLVAVNTDSGDTPPMEGTTMNDGWEDDDMAFHRLFPNADDDEKSEEDSDSDGTLPDCLRDASSDPSASIADSDMHRLFGGSDSVSSSADSSHGSEDHMVDNSELV